ncbi:MAG: RHS repeat-associated core domain-containing protein, partial [Pseudomonadota bacterium]|nr:RHS repeat-associated core domain-containing protein [Pseudomonadota bacterium]
VHMNGRIYDSKLGRFLQADPIIQEPNNGQNFNRYSYVLNNPLSYTDPSGFSFFKKFRLALGIAAAIYLPGGQGLLAGIGVSSSVAQFAITGFLTGVINSGTFKGGLIGAFTGSLGAAVPGLGQVGDFLVQSSIAGLGSVLSGGKFGHGFASAGLTRLAAPGLTQIKGDAGRAAASALVGGSISKLTGGKFSNGAVTGAMQSALVSIKATRSSAANPENSSARKPNADGGDPFAVSKEIAESNIEEARNIFRWLLDNGDLSGLGFDFVSEMVSGIDSAQLTTTYVDEFVSRDGIPIRGEAEIYGEAGGIKIFRTGANTLLGAIATFAHEVLHFSPGYKERWILSNNLPRSEMIVEQRAIHNEFSRVEIEVRRITSARMTEWAKLQGEGR